MVNIISKGPTFILNIWLAVVFFYKINLLFKKKNIKLKGYLLSLIIIGLVSATIFNLSGISLIKYVSALQR